MTYVVPEAPGIRATRTATPEYSHVYDSLVQEPRVAACAASGLVRAVIQVESVQSAGPFTQGRHGADAADARHRERLGVSNAYRPRGEHPRRCKYLRQLLDRYDGNEQLALAAYNRARRCRSPGKTSRPPGNPRYVKKVGRN